MKALASWTFQPEPILPVEEARPFFRIDRSFPVWAPAPVVTSDEIFHDLFDAILRSRSMLRLADDWDNEGSCGYAEETWWRAINFLLDHGIWIWRHCGAVIDTPRILPGPDGSIDIHWESPSCELLVNIPVDSAAPIAFYGDNKGEERIKGTFNKSGSSQSHGLLRWLTTG